MTSKVCAEHKWSHDGGPNGLYEDREKRGGGTEGCKMAQASAQRDSGLRVGCHHDKNTLMFLKRLDRCAIVAYSVHHLQGIAPAGSVMCRGVAQPGSALAWGARCRRFESSRPDHLLQTEVASYRFHSRNASFLYGLLNHEDKNPLQVAVKTPGQNLGGAASNPPQSV